MFTCTSVSLVTLKDPIERGLKDRHHRYWLPCIYSYTQRPDRKGTESKICIARSVCNCAIVTLKDPIERGLKDDTLEGLFEMICEKLHSKTR